MTARPRPAAGLEMWQATHDARAEARNRVPVRLVADEKRAVLLGVVSTVPGAICLLAKSEINIHTGLGGYASPL